MDPKSLFSLNDHLEMLSRHGDPLEVPERNVDFEYFRVWLVEELGYAESSSSCKWPFASSCGIAHQVDAHVVIPRSPQAPAKTTPAVEPLNTPSCERGGRTLK